RLARAARSAGGLGRGHRQPARGGARYPRGLRVKNKDRGGTAMAARRLTRRRMLILGLGGMALPRPFIGAGRAMAENAPDTVVYVSNAASKEIYVLAMNRESGELTVIDKVPVPGTDKPSPSSMPMAVTPDRRFLYAALRGDTFPVSPFALDRASGRLTHLGPTPLADSMAYIVTELTGRYLLGASYPGNKLTIN